MKTTKLHFSSKEEIKEFVNICEEKYLSEVAAACEIAAAGGRITTLCGPTCSGKTTTALILDDEFKKLGKELHTISIDDFYFDRDVLAARAEERGEPLDYDSPSTIDLELFGKVIEQINKGKKVVLPKFDFPTGKRVAMDEITIADEDVFLFEGIQAVYPELTKYLSGHEYTSLFISVAEPLVINGDEFSPHIVRFLRRLVRDARTRSASAEFTFSLWQGVVKNEHEHIYPNLSGVHRRINSLMAYELSVIKPFALPLLLSVPENSRYRKDAETIAKRLENIPVIDAKYVPDGSVFREFIG